MVFCATCANAMRTAFLLRNLGFHAIPLHGQMSQNKRLASLNKFRAKTRSILISTDVASRGLDIPHVDVVINFDIPTHSKDYIHRVCLFLLSSISYVLLSSFYIFNEFIGWPNCPGWQIWEIYYIRHSGRHFFNSNLIRISSDKSSSSS